MAFCAIGSCTAGVIVSMFVVFSFWLHAIPVIFIGVDRNCSSLKENSPFAESIGFEQLNCAGITHELFIYVLGLKTPKAISAPMTIPIMRMAQP